MFGFMTTGLLDLIRYQRQTRKPKRHRSKRFKQRIYWRDGGLCRYCEEPVRFEEATQDHVTPIVNGGSTKLKENIVIAHKKCNAKKAQGVFESFEGPNEDLAPESLKKQFEAVYIAASTRKGPNSYFLSELS